MDKKMLLNPVDVAYVEQFLYEAGKQAQREAGPQIIKDKFDQEYLVSGGKVIEYCNEQHFKVEKPVPISLSTLDGLIDYIKSDPDHVFHTSGVRYMVVVDSPREITVVSPEVGFYKERLMYARCVADVPRIDLGRYQETEDFQVMLQTCFAETENLNLVLKLAGSVRKEQNLQKADDGVSQKITINAGVSTAADVIVKNPVELIPYRTFCEIQQPASPFVLRFNEDGKAALFTGAGCVWEVEAKKAIAEYLKKNLITENVCILS